MLTLLRLGRSMRKTLRLRLNLLMILTAGKRVRTDRTNRGGPRTECLHFYISPTCVHTLASGRKSAVVPGKECRHGIPVDGL